MSRFLAFLITFWAGSLWTICGVVAPSLFATLDDRRLAGQLAARFFHVEALIGLVVSVLLLVIGMVAGGAIATRHSRLLIGVTTAMPLISQFALGPVMESARVAGDMARFGMLHGVAGGLFLIACVSALLLVLRVSRPAE